jgi:hypothetical protein
MTWGDFFGMVLGTAAGAALDPVVLIAEIISAALGWTRAMFLYPLIPGAAAGFAGAFMAWPLWVKVEGSSAAVDIGSQYILRALVLCAVWYWITRGIRYAVERRRA